jgi:hypothetical protein
MNDLQYFIKQNPIVKKCALVLLILIGLWTFGSFQIVVLKSSSSFVVSATRNPRDVVYSKKYTATHIKVLKRGTWYIQAKNLSNGQSATVLKSLSPIKFITQVLKDQLKAEKIASIGDRCVLYDNPSTEQTIVSSCQSQGATITSLESGTNPTKILSYMTITSAASAPDGFVAVTQNNHGQSFSVVVYNAATNDSTTLLTTKPGALTPVLVTDQNGNASYFIADKAIYKINTTGSEKIGDVPSTINKNILLAANTTQNLYIITGLSPEANEGDSDVPYTPSTLSSIKLGSRKIEVSSQTKLPSGFIFTSITTSADRLSVAGDGYGKPGSVICETKSTDLDCFKPWSLNDYVGSIVHYKNRIFYVSEGVLWEYDTLRKSSQALFASSTIKIVAPTWSMEGSL